MAADNPKQRWQFVAGVAGTVNVPIGAKVVSIAAGAAGSTGTVTIGDGPAIPMGSRGSFSLSLADGELICNQQASDGGESAMMAATHTIVFANTDMYFVAWVV